MADVESLTAVSRHFEATCFGGPADGESWASERPELIYAVPKRNTLRWDEEPTAIGPSYAEGRYVYERIAYGPLMFGAWLVESPKEHNEHQRERIIASLNLLATVAKWVSGVR